MKTLFKRLAANTPIYFKRIARIALAGASFFGGALALNMGPFPPLPSWAHQICVTGGAVCTAIVFICHQVTQDTDPNHLNQ